MLFTNIKYNETFLHIRINIMWDTYENYRINIEQITMYTVEKKIITGQVNWSCNNSKKIFKSSVTILSKNLPFNAKKLINIHQYSYSDKKIPYGLTIINRSPD